MKSPSPGPAPALVTCLSDSFFYDVARARSRSWSPGMRLSFPRINLCAQRVQHRLLARRRRVARHTCAFRRHQIVVPSDRAPSWSPGRSCSNGSPLDRRRASRTGPWGLRLLVRGWASPPGRTSSTPAGVPPFLSSRGTGYAERRWVRARPGGGRRLGVGEHCCGFGGRSRWRSRQLAPWVDRSGGTSGAQRLAGLGDSSCLSTSRAGAETGSRSPPVTRPFLRAALRYRRAARPGGEGQPP